MSWHPDDDPYRRDFLDGVQMGFLAVVIITGLWLFYGWLAAVWGLGR